MMLNNPKINNQFKCHPQDGRFVEIWENRAMPGECPDSQYTTVRAPEGRAKFQSKYSFYEDQK